MKKYRLLELTYSIDQLKKKNKFDIQLNIYKNELKKRNVKINFILNHKRLELFQIKLFGYDSSLKFISNKINSLPQIIKLIDNMPMGKLELKSINLYTNAHPDTTIHGLGFKNEKKVKESLKLLKNKNQKYQIQALTSLYYRAKYHPHKTNNMKKAIILLRKSLNKIKNKSIKNRVLKEKMEKSDKTLKKKLSKKTLEGGYNLPYLDLKTVNKFEKLADFYNVSRKARGLEKPSTSDEGFLVVYKRLKRNKQSAEKLKDIPCRKDKPEGVKWDRKREIEVLGKLGQSKKMKIPLFHKDGPLKGLPTVIHINMIMWAYSPEPKKLKESMKILENIKLNKKTK